MLQYILDKSEQLSFSKEQVHTAIKIGLCESGLDFNAKNKNSTASGVYQFINGTWRMYGSILWGENLVDKDVFYYRDNIDLALFVIQNYGTGDWNESKSCWKS